MNRSLTKFEQNLRSHRLICPGDKVFVACSGGPDSTALFFLLRELFKKWKLRLGLIHFNHGLRGKDSDRDEKFVRELAKKNQVPFFSEKAKRSSSKNNLSLEEAARAARYGFFVRSAKKNRIPKIALAHTLDDQAETVLLRILQGTGLRGLGGIREKLVMDKIQFIRPLLPFTKKEVLQYLKENRIPYCTDQTNLSLRFPRNRLRLKLLPTLVRDFNPRVAEALARIPAILAEENELLEDLDKNCWKKVLKRRTNAKIYLNRGLFLKFPPALQFRIVGRALGQLDSRSGINFETWQRLKPGLSKPRFRHSLPKDIDLALTPSRLIIYKKFAKSAR